MKLIQKYKNPISFFELFKNSTNVLIEDYIKIISDKTLTQEMFNQLLNELGIETEDIQSRQVG